MDEQDIEYAPGRFCRLAYRWHGASADGNSTLPLVCLHGSLCDSSFFDALDGALPGCRALCIDLPGHGASGRVAKVSEHDGPPSRLEEMATAIHMLLMTLEVTHADWGIAGHSLGGAVALLIIELVALRSGGAAAERLPCFFISFEGNATPACCAANGNARQVAALPQPPSVAEVHQMVSAEPVWLASACGIGDSVGVLAHRIWISLVEWCDGRTMGNATLERMQRRVPLRFVYGARSGKYHELNRAVQAAHPDAAAACVEQTGHFMLTDDPAATIVALKGLLRGLVSPS